jgi:hypothetical protein
MTIPEITVDPTIKSRLADGHPWVYRNHVRDAGRAATGQWVRLRCGGLTAYGLYDAGSAIAVRVFSRAGAPDADWVGERVWEAWEGRAALRDGAAPTTAFRWIYGEGDGLPGLVADRYGDYVVLQTYAESLRTLVPLVSSALRATDPELRPATTTPPPARSAARPPARRRGCARCGARRPRPTWWCRSTACGSTPTCTRARRPACSSTTARTGEPWRAWRAGAAC